MRIIFLPKREKPSHFYIYRYFLPLFDRGLETAAVDDGFRQRQPVQNDMYVALIRGRMNLIRHVVGVVPPALVGQNRIDGQPVSVPHRRTMPECEQLPRNEMLLGRKSCIERYRDAFFRRFRLAG